MASAVRIAPTVSSLLQCAPSRIDKRSESSAGHESAQNNTIYASSVLPLPWQSFSPSPPPTLIRASRPRKAESPAQLCNPGGFVKAKGVCFRDGRLCNSIWPRCHKGSWYGFQEHGCQESVRGCGQRGEEPRCYETSHRGVNQGGCRVYCI